MSGKIKKCGYKNGQGYCGWYTNRDGKKMFLRSTKEFIYAKYLDFNNYHFLSEKAIFDICGSMYKPDFFLYDKEYKTLIKIIEVKDTKKKAINYLERFSEFFRGIKIDYEVTWEFRSIVKNLKLESEIKEWIANFEKNYDRISVSGKNNPMWGMKHSKKTKEIIGQRTKEYMKDPEIKEKHSSSIKKFWSSDAALETKEKYRKLRKKEKKIRDKKIDSINPVIEKECVVCGEIFLSRKNDLRKTCVNGCTQKYNWKMGLVKRNFNGKKGYKTRILNYAKLISAHKTSESDFKSLVDGAKEYGSIPKNFSMSLDVVKKYFGSYGNLIKEINNG